MNATSTRKHQSTRKASARLLSGLIEIEGNPYSVEVTPRQHLGRDVFSMQEAECEPDGGSWVVKAGTPIYEIVRMHDGRIECDCDEYLDEHMGVDDGTCLHGQALIELGFLPAPSPTAKRLRGLLARAIAREEIQHRRQLEASTF